MWSLDSSCRGRCSHPSGLPEAGRSQQLSASAGTETAKGQGITAGTISDPANELGFLGRVDTRLAWGSVRIAKPDSTEMAFLVSVSK